jgi:hypothetical protein
VAGRVRRASIGALLLRIATAVRDQIVES